MYPSVETIPMHLASDYIHPTHRGGRCCVRIYLPEDEQDAPVVICSELPSNDGSSVTYSAHQIAAEEICYHRLSAPVWIEYYSKETTNGASETFELMFSPVTRLGRGLPVWVRFG
jgi:hypothetical protein